MNLKHFTAPTSFLLVALLGLAGCNPTTTLDGGSNADAGAPNSGGEEGTGVEPSASPETPIEGQIAGKPFAPQSVELTFDKASDEWRLSLDNYRVDCGVLDKTDKTAEADKLVVTVGKVAPAAGADAIEYGDHHAATFQIGVYRANGADPVTEPAKSGHLRLDTWTETPGETVTGFLELTNDESHVQGTFTAKICKR